MTFETSQTSPGVPRSYAGSTARRMGTGACGNALGTRDRTARWAASRTETCTSVNPSREFRYEFIFIYHHHTGNLTDVVFCLQENDFAVEAFHKTHPKSIDVATRTSEMSGMRAAFAHIANARSPVPKKAHANDDPFAPSPPVRLFLAIFWQSFGNFWQWSV